MRVPIIGRVIKPSIPLLYSTLSTLSFEFLSFECSFHVYKTPFGGKSKDTACTLSGSVGTLLKNDH